MRSLYSLSPLLLFSDCSSRAFIYKTLFPWSSCLLIYYQLLHFLVNFKHLFQNHDPKVIDDCGTQFTFFLSSLMLFWATSTIMWKLKKWKKNYLVFFSTFYVLNTVQVLSWIILFNPPTDPMRHVLQLTPFYRWENGSLDTLTDSGQDHIASN